jgi:hypothetical protein
MRRPRPDADRSGQGQCVTRLHRLSRVLSSARIPTVADGVKKTVAEAAAKQGLAIGRHRGRNLDPP